jgi:hypothetical protein
MLWKRMIAMVPAVVLALGGARGAVAQPEIEALILQNSVASSRGWQASGELGYTRSLVQTESGFLQWMQAQTWDLVIIEMPFDIITQKALVAQLLEDHVAAGGRLLVNFNNLDEWPRLQRLMGVSDAIEQLTPQDVLPTSPRHASYPPPGDTFPWLQAAWTDSGDRLVPSSTGIAVGLFKDGSVSMVLANDGRTIVNGFDWDSYPPVNFFAKHEIKYIMSCRADLDQSTGAAVLDIFDFLRFQDLFFQQDPLANMNFDSNFDIFDFLAFQNAFVRGCQ